MQDPLRAPVPKERRALAHTLWFHRISLVFDVGANVGQYAQRLRDVGYDGRIVSFEPLPECHASLTVTASDDPDWLVAPAMALGEHSGRLTINRSAESDMSSALPFRPDMAALLDSAAYTGQVTVDMARLDEIFGRFAQIDDVCLLKLDTQGYDLAVLAGASCCLDRMALIQSELAIEPVYQDEPDWRTVCDHLAQLGFHPILFIPGYFNRRTARLLSMDGIFARR